MDNLEKKNFINKSQGIFLVIIIIVIVIVGIITDRAEKAEVAKRESDYQQYSREYDARKRDREAEIQRYANIALNPLKVMRMF